MGGRLWKGTSHLLAQESCGCWPNDREHTIQARATLDRVWRAEGRQPHDPQQQRSDWWMSQAGMYGRLSGKPNSVVNPKRRLFEFSSQLLGWSTVAWNRVVGHIGVYSLKLP